MVLKYLVLMSPVNIDKELWLIVISSFIVEVPSDYNDLILFLCYCILMSQIQLDYKQATRFCLLDIPVTFLIANASVNLTLYLRIFSVELYVLA